MTSYLDENYRVSVVNEVDKHTCLFPLTPRCGVANVTKLIGSRPAIFPRLKEYVVCEFTSEKLGISLGL